jgi:hypothetical protein
MSAETLNTSPQFRVVLEFGLAVASSVGGDEFALQRTLLRKPPRL